MNDLQKIMDKLDRLSVHLEAVAVRMDGLIQAVEKGGYMPEGEEEDDDLEDVSDLSQWLKDLANRRKP